jgi:tetratricopeptide (TPR) repeat protein/SAM-dependent methyltransferase
MSRRHNRSIGAPNPARPASKSAKPGQKAGPEFVRLFNIGLELQKARRMEEAIQAFLQASAVAPRKGPVADSVSAILNNNLGVAYMALGKAGEAIGHYQQSLTADPNYTVALNNLGAAFKAVEKYDEAAAAISRAIEIDPAYSEAYNNLSSLQSYLGAYREAEAAVRRAIALSPESVEAHANLGKVQDELGQTREAIASFRKALSIVGNVPIARKNLGMLLLKDGQFTEGWKEFEWRWIADQRTPRNHPQPLWKGEPLNGRTLLLHAEQGLGDAIQFSRFVTALAQSGDRVSLEVHPQLVALMRPLRGVADVIPLEGAAPPFDVHLPLMSVPHVMGVTADAIPAPIPYLSADPARSAQWRERLGLDGFKIGVVWRGYGASPNLQARSAPLAAFAALANIEGVRLISLQKTAPNEPIDPYIDILKVETLGPDFDAGPQAFLDTAAVMENLDLVVTIDTSLAHLAGALGRPVWIALKYSPDWRWRDKGDGTAWYPTARLFRQTTDGDWDAVFSKMAETLRASLPDAAPRPVESPDAAGADAAVRDASELEAFMKRVANAAPVPYAAINPQVSLMAITALRQEGQIRPGWSVLDVHAGSGLALEQFLKFGLNAAGVAHGTDYEVCRAKGLNVRAADHSFADFPSGAFDLLWSSHALARSVAPAFTLTQYHRLLKRNGMAYVEVPAPDTSAQHHQNPNFYSVLPLSSWQCLFLRAGFAVERVQAANMQTSDGPDAYWSFLLRRHL